MNKLKTNKEGTLHTSILDGEGDEIVCTFNNDDCVQLDTDTYTFIELSVENLYELIDLIGQAQERYKG